MGRIIQLSAGMIAVVMGWVFILAWHLEIYSLLRLSSSDYQISYMSSMAVFLSGVALLFFMSQRLIFIGKILGGVILLYASCRLFEIVSLTDVVTTNPWFQRLFFVPPGGSISFMRLMSSFGFIYYGMVLLFWPAKIPSLKGSLIVIVFSFLTILSGLMGVISYVFPFRAFLERGDTSSIHAYTPILLIILGIGSIGARFSIDYKQITLSSFLPILCGLVLVVATIILGLGIQADRVRVAWMAILYIGGGMIAVTMALLIYHWQLERKVTIAQKVAKQAKTEYISAISHEMRTPLTTIHGVLGLLQMHNDFSEKTLSQIHLAYKNSEILIRIINDFLDVERLEVGKFSVHKIPIRLQQVLHEAVTSQQPIAEKKQIKIYERYKESSLIVLGDHERLVQVMTNFLSNAIKYSHSKGIIDVLIQEEKNQVRVLIRDSGAGIPQQFQHQVFQKFFIDSSRTTSIGLGLSIAKGIIDQLGGEVGFISKENEGSTFYFTLEKADYEEETAA